MSQLDTIQSALARAAARRRWLRGWNGLWRGLFAGAVVWLIALAVFKLAPVPYTVLPWAAVLAGALTLGGFLHGWFHKPTLQQTARWVDDQQRLQERLSTALELGASGASENWRVLIVADAARFASKLDPRQLIPFHLPRATHWALAALAVGAGLGFLPEYRTQAFLQKQQDARAVKEAGAILLDLTQHNLEHRAPLLPPTEHSLQDVQELALKLDKVALSRSDALKDLANVSEKIKSQQNDLGRQIPALKSLEKAARDASRSPAATAAQKEMEALQKSLGKSADSPEALEKLAADLRNAEKALASMPKGDTPGASAARQQMSQSLSDIAKQAEELGQPLPDLAGAIAALQSSRMDVFRRDLDAATTDLDKLKEMAQALQKLQQQADHPGKDLPEQLQLGQTEAAQGTLQKMIDRLKSGAATPEEAAKTLDEVARSIEPASPYGNASDFLKKAAQQLRADEKPGAAQSLASASKELEKIMSQMADAKALSSSLAALQKAETCLGQCRGTRGGANTKLAPGAGHSGVGGWTPDDSTLYPEMSASWDNTGIVRPDTDPRAPIDRGEPQLADNLNPTKFNGQLVPGGPMPSITLTGVAIKGTSSVEFQQAATAAQSDAQSALNQDQVPRAYQGAVKSYFDDLKK
jgi:polyhydroxyalkanoate synthesis regulator phasin/predicted  nucleic acid-binding Zn-ribbon protein